MFPRCVNPNCRVTLLSFAGGRLYQFEIVSISLSASDDMAEPFDEKPQSQTAQFWLCGDCASEMTLLLEPVRGLRLLPLTAEAQHLPQIAVENSQLLEANNC
ncbi:MAG: hypothetical protein NVS1B11_02510 [Terriglobales bacterium]